MNKRYKDPGFVANATFEGSMIEIKFLYINKMLIIRFIVFSCSDFNEVYFAFILFCLLVFFLFKIIVF